MPNGYVVYRLRGEAVAGAGPMFDDTQRPGWCTYIGVEDADRTARAAAKAGAAVLVEPFGVPGYGRVGVLADPAGAEFWIWQPLGFAGADVNGQAGTVCRQELATRDVGAARAFYTELFGEVTASFCRSANRSDREIAPAWLVSFGVESAAAAAARAQQLGGSISAVVDSSAILVDPHGCRFVAVPASN
jgi:predicted enzyme related to lactoylglutathione lyase